MAKNKLKDKQVAGFDKPGVYGDGDRLYLRVQDGKAGTVKSWLLIYTFEGKRRELGLGGYPAIGLAVARKKADAARDLLSTGVDPKQVKHEEGVARVEAAARTVEAVAEQYIKAKIEPVFTKDVAARSRGYVRNQMKSIAAKRVDAISIDDVEAVLTPIWNTPTGPYVRSFMERVFSYAKAKGYRTGENPAIYRGTVQEIMPAFKRRHKNHTALPWLAVSGAYAKIAAKSALASSALRFTILTASRQREVREATWREFDLDAALWTIPAERYKTRIKHKVPLTKEELDLLRALASNRDPDEFVFPGASKGRPICETSFQNLLDDLDIPCMPHGFRSTFATWATANGFTNELAQRCLGHKIGSEVDRAYDRHDYLPERRKLFDAWAAFIAVA